MILWLLACGNTEPLTPHDDNPFHGDPPSIESISADCDPEAGEWEFEVTTQNWTGGGWVWMGVTANNAEGHRLRSVKAAADGSSDRLFLQLDIEPDWRDATRSKSTRYLCSDRADMTFMVTAYDPRGDRVEDCRTWGSNPNLWTEVDSAYDCSTLWETDDDTASP